MLINKNYLLGQNLKIKILLLYVALEILILEKSLQEVSSGQRSC